MRESERDRKRERDTEILSVSVLSGEREREREGEGERKRGSPCLFSDVNIISRRPTSKTNLRKTTAEARTAGLGLIFLEPFV